MNPKANFFWPLALFAVFAVALVAVVAVALVGELDVDSMRREQNVVENGIGSRIKEVADAAASQVVWDAAVSHLENAFDPQWAAENIGAFFSQTHGFEATLVLDSAEHPIFAADHGRPVDTHLYERYAGEAAALITSVRNAEAKRGALTRPKHDGRMQSATIQASTLAKVGGGLFILTGTLVQPDFGTVTPLAARAPILLTAMPLDPAFIRNFADRFLLKNLRLQTGTHPPDSNLAHVDIKDQHGEPIALLTWTPQNPGHGMMHKLGLPVLGMLVCLAVGVLMFYRRGLRMAAGLIASEARAAHLAYHDSLTGLPNRVLFFDRLGTALKQMHRSSEVLAVHCLDLDRLKEINDTFGHHVGDELIRKAAVRIGGLCRSSDTFARLSGDEFAIIQPRATLAASSALAARVTAAMAQPFDLRAGRVFSGCSVGISVISDSNLQAAETLRQADLALYRAKQAGKGQFCYFDAEMDVAMKARRALERDLRDALANESIYLAYQPQINDSDGMTGVEALARWRHPTRGDVPPSVFVPVAEECGLIIDLGMYTLRRAFEDSKRWPNLSVAVNVSAKQLRMRDFVSKVTELVREVDVDMVKIELEITEGVLMGDDPDVHDMLKQLRNLGFSLALDDLLTGYSSLSYLQRYPITKIKIDRSFISNLGTEADAESNAVIDAIVRLAKAFKLSVIAEGVETHDQRRRLRDMGCHDMQGYLFSRPVAAEEIDRLYGATYVMPQVAVPVEPAPAA